MRKHKIIGLLFLLSLGSSKSAVFKEEETEIEEFGGALVKKTPQGDEVVQARMKRSALGILAASSALCRTGTVSSWDWLWHYFFQVRSKKYLETE